MLYWFVRKLFELFYRFGCRLQIEGRENLVAEGPAIIIANHVSFWDPPLVSAIASRRQMHFMAKEELFRNPLFGWILRRINVFPVKRGAPDRKAIKHALDVLARGELLAMFPEGTRSKTGILQKPEPGAAMFALKTGAPVIPVALFNSGKILRAGGPFPRLTVLVGKPFRLEHPAEQKLTGERLETAGAAMMAAIAQLLAVGDD
jgi:1-acyl-sn-glycerol-3-phosphate acyltransferase